PTLDDFLPGAPTVRHALLVELAHADLEYRLRAGETACAEDYLGKYPDLRGDRSAVLELIATEFRIRSGQNGGISIEDYPGRFPEYAAELRSLLSAQPEASTAPGGSSATGDPAPRIYLRGQETPAPPMRSGAEGFPHQAGRCTILGEIARGGMGAVFKG